MDPSWDIEKKKHATFSFLSFPGENKKSNSWNQKKGAEFFVAIINFFPIKKVGVFGRINLPGSKVLNLAINFFPISLMNVSENSGTPKSSICS